MIRAAGGGPASSRARRRASPPAVNFFGFFLDLLLLIGRVPRIILPFQSRLDGTEAARMETISKTLGFTQTS